jgi:tetratricopeptide (TPR) repeat protein
MSIFVDFLLSNVKSLKAKATARRNRGQFDFALKLLEDACQLLNEAIQSFKDNPSALSDIQAELADTHGMIGGIFRRKNELEKALLAYEEGLEYEKLSDVSTYNLVNTISLSVIVRRENPLNEPLNTNIQRAVDALQRKVTGVCASRVDEWWAYADLGALLLLSNQTKKASSFFLKGLAVNPPGSEVRRSFTLVHELANALPASAADLALSMQQEIEALEKQPVM